MHHGNYESPFTFIIEQVPNISIVPIDIDVHQELNEHDVEQKTSDSLKVMLVQTAESTLAEVCTVIVVSLESEDSWNVFTLLLSHREIFLFQLVKFFG